MSGEPGIAWRLRDAIDTILKWPDSVRDQIAQ